MINEHKGKELVNLWIRSLDKTLLKSKLGIIKEGLEQNIITDKEYEEGMKEIGELIYDALKDEEI